MGANAETMRAEMPEERVVRSAALALAEADGLNGPFGRRRLAGRFAEGLLSGEWGLDVATRAAVGLGQGLVPARTGREPEGADPMVGRVDLGRHAVPGFAASERYDFRGLEESAAMLSRLMDAAMAMVGAAAAGCRRELRQIDSLPLESGLPLERTNRLDFGILRALARGQWNASVALARAKGPAPYFARDRNALMRTLHSKRIATAIKFGELDERWRRRAAAHGLRWTHFGDPAPAPWYWEWSRVGEAAWAHGAYRVWLEDGRWHASRKSDLSDYRWSVGLANDSRGEAYAACAEHAWGCRLEHHFSVDRAPAPASPAAAGRPVRSASPSP